MYGVKCWKMKQILLKYRQYVVLPPNWVPRGDLLSIAMHIISSIFKLLTVTHGQGLMSIKFNALFMYKQHPTAYSIYLTFTQLLFVCIQFLYVIRNVSSGLKNFLIFPRSSAYCFNLDNIQSSAKGKTLY